MANPLVPLRDFVVTRFPSNQAGEPNRSPATESIANLKLKSWALAWHDRGPRHKRNMAIVRYND
jgi:hypothetical protein